MSDSNSSINITLGPQLMDLVVLLAKQEGESVANLARTLIHEGLENRKDGD